MNSGNLKYLLCLMIISLALAISPSLSSAIFSTMFNDPRQNESAPAKPDIEKESPAPADQRFIDNGDGTVTDTKSKLMWLKDSNCIKSKYPELDLKDAQMKGWIQMSEALMYIDYLNSNKLPDCAFGYWDWRVPTEKDFLTLLDKNTPGNKVLGRDNFVLTQGIYWSSTQESRDYDGQRVYTTFLYDYGTFSRMKESGFGIVWPVRNLSLIGKNQDVKAKVDPLTIQPIGRAYYNPSALSAEYKKTQPTRPPNRELIKKMGEFPPPALKNLLINPDASQGISGWDGARPDHVQYCTGLQYGGNCFVMHGGSMSQTVPVNRDTWGKYVLLMGYVSGERVSPTDITDQPYLYGTFYGRSYYPLQGQQLHKAILERDKWYKAWGIFLIPDGTTSIYFQLGQGSRLGTPHDNSAARFDNLGVYIATTYEDAMVFMESK